MKILATASVALLSTVFLVACGGDSDSSGSSNNKITDPGASTKPVTKAPANTAPTAGANAPSVPTTPSNMCRSEGTDVFATTTGCKYSNAALNHGALQTYTCSNGRVSNGGITAKTINLNGIKIQCEA